VQYWGQQDSKYSDCLPIAIANACQFYGIPCPEPGTEAWEDVVDFTMCRHGAAIGGAEKIAEHFGLRAVQIRPFQAVGQVPVVLTVWNCEVGTAMHSVLVVGWRGNVATVVNYRYKSGSVVQRVPLLLNQEPPKRPDGHDNMDIEWPGLYIPGPPNDRCYVLEPR
jgi:hypothetical protein